MLPYLNYVGNYAEFYNSRDGAFMLDNYILWKDSASKMAMEFRTQPWEKENFEEDVILMLQTPTTEQFEEHCCLVLSPDDIYLEKVRQHSAQGELAEAGIIGLE